MQCSCNNINDPYANLCVRDIGKNTNVKVFNLMSRTNEIRYIEWHETSKCKCRFNANFFNIKERCNKDKCRCGCKELIEKEIGDKGFILNTSNCKYECDKSCDVGQYLDYGKVCNFCTIYILLFVIAILRIRGISSAFVYFHC